MIYVTELCACELVVGGGVGWSYDRRWRRAAHFFHRRRRRGFKLWSAAAASDRMREHWNSALAGQAFVPSITGVSHFTCDVRWAAGAEKLTEYARCAQFHSRNELIVHCLISGGSYKCNVECWWRGSRKRGTGKCGNKKYGKRLIDR